MSGRTRWTNEQVDVVKKHFHQHINKKTAPKKKECENLKEQYPELLNNKNWVQIKTYVYNVYRMKKN